MITTEREYNIFIDMVQALDEVIEYHSVFEDVTKYVRVREEAAQVIIEHSHMFEFVGVVKKSKRSK